MLTYIMDDNGNPVRCDVNEWSQRQTSDRTIKRSIVRSLNGVKLLISTVFLGLDHGFGSGDPVLFETMVFKWPTFRDLYCDRYTSRDDATAGHKRVLEQYLLERIKVKTQKLPLPKNERKRRTSMLKKRPIEQRLHEAGY